MKLSRKQLRRLIMNEAKRSLLNESFNPEELKDKAIGLAGILHGEYATFMAELIKRSGPTLLPPSPGCVTLGGIDYDCVRGHALDIAQEKFSDREFYEELVRKIKEVLVS
jgi:hypothetical protein